MSSQGFRLTVLGSAAPCPGPDKPCSGMSCPVVTPDGGWMPAPARWPSFNATRGWSSSMRSGFLTCTPITVRTELAGVGFSADGRTMFFNIYDPGITFAVTGPWNRRHD